MEIKCEFKDTNFCIYRSIDTSFYCYSSFICKTAAMRFFSFVLTAKRICSYHFYDKAADEIIKTFQKMTSDYLIFQIKFNVDRNL